MWGVMIYYVARVRVRCRAVFAVELTAICGVEGGVVVGHRWGGGMGWDRCLEALGGRLISSLPN